MKTVLHKAESRGRAEQGWLQSLHTFSFAQYHDPERMRFGALRVINDDIVAPAKGFDMHTHDNMEIISLPLSGSLRHEDSMGNTHLIQYGDIQIMSAGTGISHSEYNASNSEPVNLLRIWVLPKERNIKPRYHQQTFRSADRENSLQAVVAPDSEDGAIRINQEAWFSLGYIETGHRECDRLHNDGNGVYVFVIEGEADVAHERLGPRDGLGITESSEIEISATIDCELLVIEVPL